MAGFSSGSSRAIVSLCVKVFLCVAKPRRRSGWILELITSKFRAQIQEMLRSFCVFFLV